MSDNDKPGARHSFAPALTGCAALIVILAWACGGGGGPSVPACQEEAPPEPVEPAPATNLTMKVGSYEGTGSPQCIRGLGFQPALVIIKSETGQGAVWRTTAMEGDSTADFAHALPNFEDAITSLEADALSLGEDPTVNGEGLTYHYIAFGDSPDIHVGSYIGDGVDGRVIGDVGFRPVVVFTKRDGERSAIWRSDAHEEGVASFFHALEDLTGSIQGFEEDGFRLGSDTLVNSSDEGSTHYYVAFREAPGRIAVGTYVGDGADDREITGVGFQPDYVWIKGSSAEGPAVHRPASVSGDLSLRFTREVAFADEIIALEPDGFQVGSASSVNADGDTHYYVAWKANAGP